MRKLYYSLDTGICLEILMGYDLAPNLACLLCQYREKHRIVPIAGKLLGRTFGSMLFNIVVDAVVRVVLVEVYMLQEYHHRLSWAAGERNLVFYADHGWIVGMDPDWVQNMLAARVEIFGRVGLDTKLEKKRQ